MRTSSHTTSRRDRLDAAGPAVAVHDLRKRYGTYVALAGVDFTVARGEIFALLGPNGAGKTTTVEILEGYRHRDGGHVTVLGSDPALSRRIHRERIGVVLQSAGVDPQLTVGELVRLYARLYPAPRSVSDVIELVGLTAKRRARAKTLSGGQLRRLDLALALIGNPELLFLDEPTTGFDPAARRSAWDMIGNLRDLGTTVILTTHYMDEVKRLADRAAVLVAGRIIAEGSPDTLGRPDLAVESTIRFRMPTAELDGLAGEVRRLCTTDGSHVVIHTADPTHVLWVLTTWACDRKKELLDLTVERPDLEDVYLRLTSEDGDELT